MEIVDSQLIVNEYYVMIKMVFIGNVISDIKKVLKYLKFL